MKVHLKHGKVRQNMHGASRNYRYVCDVSLIHLLSVTLYLIKRFTKRQVPRGGVYGGLVILAHPRLMVRECTLIFEPSRG